MENRKKEIIKFAVSFILLMVAYLPTILWMVDRWMAKESYYGHGFLIPLVSLAIAWQRRDILKKIDISSASRGIWIIAASLFVHIVCASLKVYFISGFSFVVAIYGLILYMFGKEMAHNLTFPIFFLFAMIPLPLVLISNLTVQLKLFAAQAATFVLNRIGFVCIRDGSIIRMPRSYFSVEAPCSGLRSLISLLTLGLLFAYSMRSSYIKRGILFLSSVPIAIASNVIRIVSLGVVNDLYGEKIAMGFFHDFTGLLVFVCAFAGLYWVMRLLEKGDKKYA